MAKVKMLPNNVKALETRINADRTAEVWIYGVISDEKMNDSCITALDVVNALNRLTDADTIIVHLSSNGGDVFTGLSIYNTLRNCGKTVNIIGEGIVASIASVIALAGTHFAMAENSMLMVHNPLILLAGGFNKHDMAKMTDDLDKVRDSIVSAYTNKTGMANAEVINLLDGTDGQGTYLSPQEALAMGFCDSIIPAKNKMVAMVQPATFKCRGHTIKLEIQNAPKLPVSAKNGGNKKMPVKQRTARRGKPKAELVDILCPYCNTVVELETGSGVVTQNPAEGATVAVPLEETVEMLGGRKFRNEEWKITCPDCGGEFTYDDSPDGAITSEETGFAPEIPLVQAKHKTRVKNKRTAPVKAVKTFSVRMQTEPLPIVCTECQTEFEIDVDPAIEEATVVCPNCAAELEVDTSNVGSNSNSTPPEDNEPGIIAFRLGIADERRRLALLDERARALPQFANAIEGFKRNGTSVEKANDWIFKALASGSKGTDNGVSYRLESRHDAAVLNKLGGATRSNDNANKVAANFNSLAARRGTLKNG